MSDQEELWLDFLEDELEPSFRRDLTVLLINSVEARQHLLDLKDVRTLVKESDDVNLPEDGAYYLRLHDRIMEAIDEDRAQDPDLGHDVSEVIQETVRV